jgi:glycosyltransferase 2 family protein
MKQFIHPEQDEKLAARSASWLKATIRLAIGIGLISFLILRSDIDAIKQTLVTANPLLIAAGYLLNIGLLIVSAFRWRVFLEALEVELPVGTTLKLTLVGSFFNLFLPTGVGGDVYKAIRIHTADTNLASSFSSVLLDRIAGIATLALICFLVAIPTSLRSDTGPLVLVALVVSVAVLAVTTLLLLLGQKLVGRGQRTWFGLRPRLRRTLDATAVAVRRPETIRRSIVLGLLCQALGIAAHVALAWALDLEIALSVISLGLLIATVASSIPITVNGLGIRETVWVWSLGLYGVGRAEALAYALLILGVALATSAVGGVVYAAAGGEMGVRSRKPSPSRSASHPE